MHNETSRQALQERLLGGGRGKQAGYEGKSNNNGGFHLGGITLQKEKAEVHNVDPGYHSQEVGGREGTGQHGGIFSRVLVRTFHQKMSHNGTKELQSITLKFLLRKNKKKRHGLCSLQMFGGKTGRRTSSFETTILETLGKE